MKIWLVQTGETLGIFNSTRTLRTGKLAARLASNGHEVLWWTSSFEHQRKTRVATGEPRRTMMPGVELQFMDGRGYRKNLSIARYVDHLEVAQRFKTLSAKEAPPDLIVASLPCHQAAYEAAVYARQQEVPLVVDVRDLWPDIFVTQCPSWGRTLSRRLLNRDFEKSRETLRTATALLAVSDGYLKWATTAAQRDRCARDRVFYIGAPRLQSSNHTPDWLTPHVDRPIVAYAGTFGVSYQLDLVLAAAARFDSSSEDAPLFVIAGTGERARELMARARQLNNVLMPGWLAPKDVEALLAHSSIALAPYQMAEDTVPNKPFEYLSASLPLVSSLEGEMTQLIAQHGLGLSYQPGDLEGLTSAIGRLLDDKLFYATCRQNAAAFFETHCNSDHIYAEYASHLEQIAS